MEHPGLERLLDLQCEFLELTEQERLDFVRSVRRAREETRRSPKRKDVTLLQRAIEELPPEAASQIIVELRERVENGNGNGNGRSHP